jgi:hypothetical protein
MYCVYVLLVPLTLLSITAEGTGDCMSPYCFCNTDVQFVSCNDLKTSNLPVIEKEVKEKTSTLELKDSMIRILSLSESKWPLLKHLDVRGSFMLNCVDLYILSEWLDVISDCIRLSTQITSTQSNITDSLKTTTPVDMDMVIMQSSTTYYKVHSTTIHYFIDPPHISEVNIVLAALLGIAVGLCFILILFLIKKCRQFFTILYRDICHCCTDTLHYMRGERQEHLPMHIVNALYTSRLSLDGSEDTVFEQEAGIPTLMPVQNTASGSSTWPRTRKQNDAVCTNMHFLRVETLGKKHAE